MLALPIPVYLDAKRALERYGTQTVSSEFEMQALPSAVEDTVVASEPPHVVLDVAPDADTSVIRAAFRSKIHDAHPDQGASTAEFERVRNAKEALLAVEK